MINFLDDVKPILRNKRPKITLFDTPPLLHILSDNEEPPPYFHKFTLNHMYL